MAIAATGQYVRVQLASSAGTLSLAEVEVFGQAVPPETNLAPQGTAAQSSTNHGGVASRAIDGNTSGVWNQGSVTHTNF